MRIWKPLSFDSVTSFVNTPVGFAKVFTALTSLIDKYTRRAGTHDVIPRLIGQFHHGTKRANAGNLLPYPANPMVATTGVATFVSFPV